MKTMNNSMVADERAAFEAWADSAGHLFDSTDDAFVIWQAARAVHVQEQEKDNEWRRLALQFDGHRMQAIGHLKCMIEDAAKHKHIAEEFLSAGPLSGEAVLAKRIKALAKAQIVATPDVVLPPLPDQFGQIDIYHDSGRVTCVDGYTADQMWSYAIDYSIKLGFASQLVQEDPLVMQINNICEVTDPRETLNCISVAIEENITKAERLLKIPKDLLAVDNVKNSERLAIEEKAQAIYNTWQSNPEFVLWTHGGNSHMQERARDMARAAIAVKVTK